MKTRSKKLIATTVGATAALAGLMFAGAGPAEAASAADQAAAICGAGYYPLTQSGYGVGPGAATIYISYNSGTDCAVAIKSWDVGTPTQMYVYLQGPNASWGGNMDDHSMDNGSYSYYAGPVYTNAPGACIYFGGGFDTTFTDDYGPLYCN